MHQDSLFLPCPVGVESLLADEVAHILGHQAFPEPQRAGVAVAGGLEAVLRLNLESRLAQRVLWQVAVADYRGEDDLYALARQVPWHQWITPQNTLRVDVTAQRSPLRSLNFVGLRVKDAVCDAMRESSGDRPNVDTWRPDLSLLLHLETTRAILYVDTSGEALFKRGWRVDKGDAPLKETLAAAMLAAAGWRGTPQAGGALHDPCCGSGTIVIEAAQIACGIAPGLQRRFAFERLLPFNTQQARTLWQGLKRDAQTRIHTSAVPLSASDVAFRMVDFARRNAERAGVAECIEFHGGDALERAAPTLPAHMPGTLMINPPYGERIDPKGSAGGHRRETGWDDADTEPRRPPPRSASQAPHQPSPAANNRDIPLDFFARLASHWKRTYTQHPAGWTAWVLSPDMKLPTTMRLKESRRVPMWNGPIECRLFRFDLVSGSMRGKSGGSAAATASPDGPVPPA